MSQAASTHIASGPNRTSSSVWHVEPFGVECIALSHGARSERCERHARVAAGTPHPHTVPEIPEYRFIVHAFRRRFLLVWASYNRGFRGLPTHSQTRTNTSEHRHRRSGTSQTGWVCGRVWGRQCTGTRSGNSVWARSRGHLCRTPWMSAPAESQACRVDYDSCHRLIMWVGQTHRHANMIPVIVWVRRTHRHGNMMLSSSCESYRHIGNVGFGMLSSCFEFK